METPAVAGAEEAVKALPVPEEVLEVPRPAEPAAEPNPSDPAVVEAESSTPAPVQPVPSEPAVVDAKSSEPAPVEPEPSEPAVADAAEAAPAEKSESTVPAGEGSEPTPPQQVGLFPASALCSGSLLGVCCEDVCVRFRQRADGRSNGRGLGVPPNISGLCRARFLHVLRCASAQALKRASY